MYLPRLRTVRDGVREVEGAGRDVRGIFAEAVSRDVARLGHARFQNAQRRHRDSQNRRLRDLG